MKLKQSVKMAVSAVLSNKMRSFLTMLGIIIGVLSVTLLISLVQGATGQITDQLDTLGGNNIAVTVMNRQKKLTYSELKKLEEDSDIALVSPSLNTNLTVKAGGESVTTSVYGITAAYEDVQGLTIEQGRGISSFDQEENLAVCVIGVGAADDLFGTADVLDHSVKISGQTFRIIGVLEEEDSDMMGSTNDSLYIPLSRAQRIMKQTSINEFYVSAQSEDTLSAAQADVQDFLFEKYNDEDAYMVINMSSIVDIVNTVLGTMSLMLGAIAAISLVVGGIGIMNIMLVSVTERTREIGIRKAIGAQRSDITVQFMIESMVISLMGGVIGMVICQIILTVMNHIWTDYHFAITPSVGALALGFSIAIGLIFGIYPASKAAKLKPINALRYE